MAAPGERFRRFALLTGLYFAGAVLATLYLRTPEDVTLFWPSAGVGYAVVVRYGLGWVAIVPVAMGLMHALVLPVPPEFLPYSIGSNTLATLLAGWYVRRQRRELHLEIGDGLLLLRGGILLGLVSATIGTVGLVEAGMIPAGDSGRALVLWLLGDVLGITTLAPSLSVLLGRGGATPRMRVWGGEASRRERIAWMAILALCLSAIWIAGRSGNLYALGLVSLPLALLLWAAIRFSPILAMLATIAVVVFLSLVTGLGLGGFTRPLTLLDSSVLMSLLILISVIPVMLSVSNHEKRSTAVALYRRATRDPLTGLLNRKSFDRQLDEAMLQTTPRSCALVLIDLDRFKPVNDNYGHRAGDLVLQQVAERLHQVARGSDTVTGGAGDDVVVLPSGRRSTVAAVETADGPLEAARPGQSVTIRLADDIDVSRGDLLDMLYDVGIIARDLLDTEEVPEDLGAPLADLGPQPRRGDLVSEPPQSLAPGARVRTVRVEETSVHVEEDGPVAVPTGNSRRRLDGGRRTVGTGSRATGRGGRAP